MAEETAVKDVAGQDRSKAKEEEKILKEKLLDEKMKLIRQKNEERLRRQKEIEEDIKYASLHSNQVAEEKPSVAEHKMAGVQKDSSSAITRMRGRARGRMLAKMAKEELHAHRFENKRKQNYENIENELQKEKMENSPPRGGPSSFLSDERRVDMSKVSSRSPYSWGGSQFEDVVEKVNKEKHAQPRKENLQNIEVVMTGKQRKEYQEWKEERTRIDKERKFRQKSGESWKREWDKEKVHREVSSTHERHDQHHTIRSGQRFGERARRKPDWDLHDHRVPKRDVNHTDNNNENDNWEESNDKMNSVLSSNKAEDWKDSSSTSIEIQSGSGIKEEAISTADWEDIETTKINKNKDSNTNKETNTIVDRAAINSEIPKEYHTTDKADSKELEETINHEEADINTDIKNLTVTIDSEGKRNITDELTNNNIDSHPEEIKGTDKNESAGEAIVVKQGQIIEQPKPQRIHKKRQQRKEKESPKSSKDQKKMDLTKEIVEKEEKNSSRPGETNVTDVQIQSDSTTDSTSSSPHEKSKDSLPKLEIKKNDETCEPVPDFLKTPQKKNWADCEFDEELDLPPLDLEWSILTK